MDIIANFRIDSTLEQCSLEEKENFFVCCKCQKINFLTRLALEKMIPNNRHNLRGGSSNDVKFHLSLNVFFLENYSLILSKN